MKVVNINFTENDLITIAKDRAKIHVKNFGQVYGGKLSPRVVQEPNGTVVVQLVFEESE